MLVWKEGLDMGSARAAALAAALAAARGAFPQAVAFGEPVLVSSDDKVLLCLAPDPGGWVAAIGFDDGFHLVRSSAPEVSSATPIGYNQCAYGWAAGFDDLWPRKSDVLPVSSENYGSVTGGYMETHTGFARLLPWSDGTCLGLGGWHAVETSHGGSRSYGYRWRASCVVTASGNLCGVFEYSPPDNVYRTKYVDLETGAEIPLQGLRDFSVGTDETREFPMVVRAAHDALAGYRIVEHDLANPEQDPVPLFAVQSLPTPLACARNLATSTVVFALPGGGVWQWSRSGSIEAMDFLDASPPLSLWQEDADCYPAEPAGFDESGNFHWLAGDQAGGLWLFRKAPGCPTTVEEAHSAFGFASVSEWNFDRFHAAQPQLAFIGNGEGGGTSVQYARFCSNQWQVHELAAATASVVHDRPRVGVDSSGNVVVCWRETEGAAVRFLAATGAAISCEAQPAACPDAMSADSILFR